MPTLTKLLPLPLLLAATMIPAVAAQIEREPSAALAPFTAEYEVNYGSIGLGHARFQLASTHTNAYEYRLDSALGLLLLSDKRHAVSEFTHKGDQLIPMRYTLERTGTGSDFQEQAAFAKDQKTVYSRYKGEKAQLPYEGVLYDTLMAQLQFRMDLIANKTDLKYDIVKEGEIETYGFEVLGKERMKIPSGSYETIKIKVLRKSKKRETFFWMSPELNYLPIRLSHFEKGSKQLDIKLLSYKFDKPMANQGVQQTTVQPLTSNP